MLARRPNHLVIISLTRGRETWYMEWNTSTGAPHGWGTSLEQFVTRYAEHYGLAEAKLLPSRMRRVEKRQCSDPSFDIGELLDANYAGFNEYRLDAEDIVEWYCIKRELPPEKVIRHGKVVMLGEPAENPDDVEGNLAIADEMADEYAGAFADAAVAGG